MNSLIWVLVGFGLILLLLFPLYVLAMNLRPRRQMQLPTYGVLPGLSVIVVVRDGAELIKAKLRNLLEQDYPGELIEIIVYADGCTDNTVQLVRAISSGIRVIECTENHGKIQGMNRAVNTASHDILVFSDADALLASSGLRGLAAYFSDLTIGGVCARRVINDQGSRFNRAQGDYISFDNRVKLAENDLGSITSNDGKLYAMRRTCYRQVPDAVTDDLYTAMLVIRSGKRFVFAPEVTVWVATPSRGIAHEVARRRRIVSTSLRGIWILRELLNPWRYGRYSFSLFFNKVMRRLLPLGLLPLGLALLLSAPFIFLLAGLAGVTLILSRSCLPEWLFNQVERVMYVSAGLYGTLLGLIALLRGEAPTSWKPYKQDDQVATPGKPRIAYTMSRFPKITETFVLYEMLEVEKTGLDILVFPLILLKENTEHPEVASILPKVHFAPFISLAIVQANLCWLLKSPGSYLGAWWDALHSAWPNRNFLIGALGVLPKSALYARQVQQMGVVHLHAHFATHAALAARFIHTLSGIPYSFTAHGHDVHISLQGFDAKARDAQFWVTISQYNLDLVANTFNSSLLKNAHLVHCGIDLARLQPSRPSDDDNGVFGMLCVASFKEVKGHTYLISACSRLQKQGIHFHCRLIGDGPLRYQVEQQIVSAGLQEYITLSGQQPQPVVLEAMRTADVVVLPSILASRGDREGIPVCLMEAMALERPVISSNLSGIPELVTSGKEGLLVEQKDSIALAKALEQLANDPQLCVRMGAMGRQKIEHEFDLHSNAGILAGLLKDT